jgi:hypothetical protein
MTGTSQQTTRGPQHGSTEVSGEACGATRRTITTRRQVPPVYHDDTEASRFSRTITVGVVYGLVGWLQLVLWPAYALSGLLPDRVLTPYATGPDVWAISLAGTAAVLVVVAVGLVGGRDLAWRVAPWCVIPNLVAHILFISVLPVWGAIAIACDLLAAGVVLGERHHRGALAARKIRRVVRKEATRGALHTPQLLGNRRPT